MTKLYGLIGNPLSHSLSKDYFTRKFESENLTDCQYRLFQLNSINEFQSLISDHPELKGLNVTLPFKKEVIKYFDELSPEANEIGAVNCIKVYRSAGSATLTGFNTDVFGFVNSIKPLLKPNQKKALVVGTGGSAAAVAKGLKSLGIGFIMVSRNPKDLNQLSYKNINQDIILQHLVIINATPVGMSPHSDICPNLPYEYITSNHLLFDLVYNPMESLFLKKGKEKGAMVKNGLQMLYLQAEKSWEIWHE
jgi:shikimate dehydrogenase